MIEPYGSVLKAWEPKLAALGFVQSQDSDHASTWVRGGHALELGTEPHYPGLAGALRTPGGAVYELGTLEEALAPAERAQRLSVPCPLEAQLAAGTLGGPARDAALRSEAEASVEWLCRFLSAHGATLFDAAEPYRAAYEAAGRARLARLGLRL